MGEEELCPPMEFHTGLHLAHKCWLLATLYPQEDCRFSLFEAVAHPTQHAQFGSDGCGMVSRCRVIPAKEKRRTKCQAFSEPSKVWALVARLAVPRPSLRTSQLRAHEQTLQDSIEEAEALARKIVDFDLDDIPPAVEGRQEERVVEVLRMGCSRYPIALVLF